MNLESWWRWPCMAWEGLLQAVGADCPLCGARVGGGGLCPGCHDDVVATMHPDVPRCRRCALRLGEGGEVPQRARACPDCRRRRPALDWTIAGFDYEAPADLLISRFKEAGDLSLARPIAGLILRALDAEALAALGAVGSVAAQRAAAPNGAGPNGAGPNRAGLDGDGPNGDGPARDEPGADASCGGASCGRASAGGASGINASGINASGINASGLDASAAAASTAGAPAGGQAPPRAFLVPIPASRASLRRRGFNPAAELARALGRQCRLPCRAQWLQRTGYAPKQATLTREARLTAPRLLYTCPQPVTGATVALVDDVMTTGSTLDAAALVLRAAGAARVVALVAARAPAGEGGTLAQYRLP